MLYVVGTPIGNLEDISKRAVEVLKTVDRIYCEDTRHSRVLLDKLGIKTPTESLHHHSSEQKIEAIVRELKNGATFAYISDAGTPGVADPVGLLAEACHTAGVEVSPIPGASAVTAILSVAGFPANSYRFAGYVPTKKGRQTFIKQLLAAKETTVIFETAPRFLKLLEQLIEFGGAEKEIVVGRELTKQFEEVIRGSVFDLKEHFTAQPPRGEFVVALRDK